MGTNVVGNGDSFVLNSCLNDFSNLDTIIEPMLQSMLLEIQQNHAGLLAQAFYKDGEHYKINTPFLKYLQKQKVTSK